jgi:hypothetical protein
VGRRVVVVMRLVVVMRIVVVSEGCCCWGGV